MTFRILLALAFVCGLGISVDAQEREPRAPNVLVILADDLGFSDLGSYGGEIDTPNLDRLAAGGLRYTQGYNTARCWPTRAALLTGYYPQAIGRDKLPGGHGGAQGARPGWATLLSARLAKVGFRSYHSGKWHIDGNPRGEGFDRSLDATGVGQSNFFDPTGVKEDGKALDPADDFYSTTAIGDHAVKCLADHARDHTGKPFFSYVAFTAPHFPLHAPQDVIAKYRDRYRAGWDKVRAERAKRLAAEGIVTTALSEVERELGPPYHFGDAMKKLGPNEVNRPVPWDSLSDSQREFQATKMAIHAAMVDVMDREIGRLLNQLAEMGALDNTLILFLSDNGASAEMMIRGEGHDPTASPGSRKTFLSLGPGWSTCANTPFRRHKTWVHEGGIATPWIVHWPVGIAAKGELRTQPVHAIDLVPTVLELARVEGQKAQAAPPMQGKSFAASLRDAAAAPAHESLWWCHEGHRAVRMGDWKLVAAKGDPWELYDLATDRCETKNLAADQPDRVAALEKEWNRIAEECRGMAPVAAPSKKRRPLSGRRPNIIYVMTDDQGYGDLASHGNPIIKTPCLDKLRDESVRLTEYHVSPTCSPTRAALMTGRHEFRSGVTHTIHERERLALDAVTLPQLLKTAGYTSGIFGKWHLGDEDAYQPGKRGFDRVFVHGAGGIGQTYPGSCGDVPGNSYFDPVIRSDGAFVRTKGYCTDVFFDAAIEWIPLVLEEQKPFFCYIATNAPHGPYHCPPGSDEKYRAPLEAAHADPKERERIAKFYAMIENIDTNVGRLLAKLDAWGIADDTLVVFTTDNGSAQGPAIFNDGMKGYKGSPYRGGTRVPAFWRWPGTLPAGVDVSAVTAHIDVLPTLCELGGVEIPPVVAARRIEGRSLVPLLEDAEAEWDGYRLLVTHVGRWARGKASESEYANCRARLGRWEIVRVGNRQHGWELYDIETDPGERHNVAAEHPDVVAHLARGYDAWWHDVQKDLVNEDVDGPDENPFKVAFWNQFGPEAKAGPEPLPKRSRDSSSKKVAP